MGSSTTVRISEDVHALLQEMARESASSMSSVIEVALREHRKRLFWARARREFEELRRQAGSRRAEREEAELWDVTIADGLDGDDDW